MTRFQERFLRKGRAVSFATGLTLAAALLAVALPAICAYTRGSTCTLLFDGCDSFVYATMADDFRQARATGEPPRFLLQDSHTEWLIALLQHSKFDSKDWKQTIAPHGFHYFAASGQVGPQYPPGTGWTLSLFPKSDCIRGLNKAAILGVSFIGLLLMVGCAWKRLVVSILMVALAIAGSIDGYFRYDSFSIDAALVPILLGTLAGWLAVEGSNRAVSVLLGFFSGLMFGLAMQDRVASVLLAPTMALVFLPRRWLALAAFTAGAIVNGILPLLRHDQLVAGGYFASTYDNGDTEQSFRHFWRNAGSYGWDWLPCTGFFFLAALVAALAALALYARWATGPGSWRDWLRERAGLLAAPAVTLALGVAFFLTHAVAEPYYLSPTVMVAFLLVTFTGISVERNLHRLQPRAARNSAFVFAASAFALLGLIVSYLLTQEDLFRDLRVLAGPRPAPFARLDLPPPLADKNAWIWCDRYSGTVRYMDSATGYKIGWGPEELHEFLFSAVHDKGDPQYLLEDSDSMKNMEAEARRHGWQLQPVGFVDKSPCYRMER